MNAIKKIVMGLAVACAAAVCSAADIYVATPEKGGDDGNSGTSDAPFATIAKGIAAAKTAGGGTVYVGAGTYEESGLVVDAAIKVVGTGATRDDVIVDAKSEGRTFKLSNAGAVLSGLTIKNGMVTGSNEGANVWMAAAATVTNCVVRDGTCPGGNYGGANIYVTVAGALVVDTELVGGASTGTGNANGLSVHTTQAATFRRCTIRDTVRTSGGATSCIWPTGNTVFENCLMTGCKITSETRSVLIIIISGTTKLVNCTIVGNRMSSNLINGSDKMKAYNCVIFDNGGTAAKEWTNSNAGNFVNCAFAKGIYKGTASTVEITKEDDFVDYDGGKYAPKAYSALINAGNNANYNSYATSATDLAGNDRIQDDIIDIGCYETANASKQDMSVVVTDAKVAYDGEAHTATVAVTDPTEGCTITWDDVSKGENGPAYADAGFYTNVFTVTARGYNDFVGTGVVEIAKKPVTIAWGPTELDYEAAPLAPEATAVGVIGSDAVTVVVEGAKTDPGNYTATATGLMGADAANYVLSGDNLTTPFTIRAVELTPMKVSVEGVTDPYDGLAHTATLTVTEPADAEIKWWSETDRGFTLDEQPGRIAVGSYQNVVQLRKSGYETTVLTCKVEIAVAPVTVAWGSTVFYFSGNPQAPTATAVGVVGSEEVTVTVEGAQTEIGGPYTATATGLGGADAANYTLSGTLTTTFKIRELLPDVYVATTGNDETGDGTSGLPYATIAKGVEVAKAMISHGQPSNTVHVSDGEYTLDATIELNGPIVISGNVADPSSVIVNNEDHRAFNLSHADARIEGVTIQGKGAKGNGNEVQTNVPGGGHIHMTAGTIADCVIDGGQAGSSGGEGGNVFMTGGRIVRCTVKNGLCGPENNNKVRWGANIFATGGIIENTLVTGGCGDAQTELYIRGSGLYLDGSVTVCNTTVVKNSARIGTKGETASAGVWINKNNAKLCNCVIYDNMCSNRIDLTEARSAKAEWGNQNAGCFVNCAVASGATITGGMDNIDTVTDAAFKNCAKGNYHPARGGVLVNAGTTWDGYVAAGGDSETDLDRNPRKTGKYLDIGCYEDAGSGTLLIIR